MGRVMLGTTFRERPARAAGAVPSLNHSLPWC